MTTKDLVGLYADKPNSIVMIIKHPVHFGIIFYKQLYPMVPVFYYLCIEIMKICFIFRNRDLLKLFLGLRSLQAVDYLIA